MSSTSSDRSPLTPLEYGAIAAAILIWGVNNAAAKYASDYLPPMAIGALRFLIASVFLIPFLRPPFPRTRYLAILVLFGGPIHFALIYWGFSRADDLTPYAVTLQLWIPMTALFAWVLLKETLSVPAIGGLVLAFLGVAVMSLDERALREVDAILIGVAASAAWAIATVAARRTRGVPALKIQGLVSLVSGPTFLVASLAFDRRPVEAALEASWLVWLCVLWAAVSTVVGNALMFWLVQRREAGRVTPYFLSTPVLTMILGVTLLGDVLTPQILVGAGATIGGVALVALAERGIRPRFRRVAATSE